MIYFIRAGSTSCVKVGKTDDLPRRFVNLQTGNHEQLTLEAIADGDERAMQRRFAEKRIRGEWFRLMPQEVASIPEVRRPSAELLRAIQRELSKQELRDALDVLPDTWEELLEADDLALAIETLVEDPRRCLAGCDVLLVSPWDIAPRIAAFYGLSDDSIEEIVDQLMETIAFSSDIEVIDTEYSQYCSAHRESIRRA